MCTVNHKKIVDNYTREHYTSFLDIMNSIKNFIEEYIVKIDMDTLPITKNYNLRKDMNYNISSNTSDKLVVEESIVSEENKTKSHYSKEIKALITKEIKKNMEFGTQIHEVFEMIDFMNPRLEELNIPEFYKKKVKVFLNQDIFKKEIKNIYKEYEFIYEENKKEKHGVIDLILEYVDGYTIIDYKTKNIEDIEYENQLRGYQMYLEKITNLPVDIYIYSILDEQLKRL